MQLRIISIAGVPAEIRTKHLPNTSLEHLSVYQYVKSYRAYCSDDITAAEGRTPRVILDIIPANCPGRLEKITENLNQNIRHPGRDVNC
jgi:hypothetical protein